MQDTTPFVPKEVLITCGLFLVILVVGTFAFDLYNKHTFSSQITSATTAELSRAEKNISNKITSGVIGITGTATYESEPSGELGENPQIGVYSILPSFSIIDEYHIVDDYDALQKQIRIFHTAVEACKEDKPLDSCITETLNKPAYVAWLDEENCETSEEALFYDFTDMFSQCLQSEDTDCTCVGTFSPEKYDSGEYMFSVFQQEDDVLFSLDTTTLSTLLPHMNFAVEGATMATDAYTFRVEGESVSGSFSSLEPSSILYLYKKDATTLSVESESAFTTYQLTRTACSIPEKHVYKFCVQSPQAVSVYDPLQEKIIQQPVVYMFAVDFG